MVDSGATAVTSYLRGLSPSVRRQVRERRRRLLGGLEGRILDLAGDDRHVDLYRRATEVVCRRRPPDPDEAVPFDHVVSLFRLSASADPDDLVRRVAVVLAPGGTLEYLEPYGEPGWRRHAQRVAGMGARPALGWRVDLDVPGIIAANGLVPIDAERIRMPRYQWPVHGLVQGRARPPGGHRPVDGATAASGEER